MYIAAVTLLMFVLPVLSVVIESLATHNHGPLLALIGTWFVFWAIGVRLFTAGIRQTLKPGLTSEGILGIKGKESWTLVRELGFANIAMGLAGIVSLWKPGWDVTVALIGGLFLLLDGCQHLTSRHRNLEENVAMWSDLLIGLLMAVFVISRF
jgi:hypothetical protein